MDTPQKFNKLVKEFQKQNPQGYDLDEVYFKSTPINWNKEKSGLKKNTVRVVDVNDERFKLIKHYEPLMTKKHFFINIVNTETKEVFSRCLTDITYFENMVILSWI